MKAWVWRHHKGKHRINPPHPPFNKAPPWTTYSKKFIVWYQMRYPYNATEEQQNLFAVEWGHFIQPSLKTTLSSQDIQWTFFGLSYQHDKVKAYISYGTSGIRSNILSWSSTFTALRRKQASKTLIKYSNQPHKRCSSMRRCHIKENPLTEWGISFIFPNVKEWCKIWILRSWKYSF